MFLPENEANAISWTETDPNHDLFTTSNNDLPRENIPPSEPEDDEENTNMSAPFNNNNARPMSSSDNADNRHDNGDFAAYYQASDATSASAAYYHLPEPSQISSSDYYEKPVPNQSSDPYYLPTHLHPNLGGYYTDIAQEMGSSNSDNLYTEVESKVGIRLSYPYRFCNIRIFLNSFNST